MQIIRKIIHWIIERYKMTNSTRVNEAIDQAEQRPKASSAKLTAGEVKKAIYIDYEGNYLDNLRPAKLAGYRA